MTAACRDAGSFRDPSGTVLVAADRVFRTVMPLAAADYLSTRRTGILEDLVSRGLVVDERPVAKEVLGPLGEGASYVVEHPKLPFISYPYEWCFHALKDAALLHLDVHLRSLERGVTLSDASAFNIQFLGPTPVFIDTLSFRPYREGEIWAAHRQFCDHFLNPLLLRALLGIPHNAWYRGCMEGIPVEHLASALPFRAKLSWNVLKHVVLHAMLEKSSASAGPSASAGQVRLPLAAFRRILNELRDWVGALQPKGGRGTVWQDYAQVNSYSADEARNKARFVGEFAAATRPKLLWDLGCNSGDYSKAALDAGAGMCVGFDFDAGALEAAYLRARAQKLKLLPLHLDATNPSPSQGWAQHERKGMLERGPADGVIALAFVHHLAVARNVPLDYVVDWLTGLAGTGVIEFVQKDDPMVRELLRLRDDIFPGYAEENFARALRARARVCKVEQVSASGRKLYWFERT
ncbi:MAG: class I SAM-dependent methyltransferase [Burkholderiales bacterium]